MITAQRKPFDELYKMLEPYQSVLVAGCGGCVTVCLTGGERQAQDLAAQLKLAAQAKGLDLAVDFDCITRQCDGEYVKELADAAKGAAVVLSTACGVGVNYMTEVLSASPDGSMAGPVVLPAMNTLFMGANLGQGQWSERCAGCGDCVLERTGGICPIARCAKNLMNGPCGGTKDGKCEVSKDIDCAWYMIVKRMEALGRTAELMEVIPPRNWATSRDGGPRRMILEQSVLEPASPAKPAK
jgi:hypothetical protein